MAHEIAKLILEHAGTFLEREEAVRTAISLGMPLQIIEEYLDWIDHHRPLPEREGENEAGDRGRETGDRSQGAGGGEAQRGG